VLAPSDGKVRSQAGQDVQAQPLDLLEPVVEAEAQVQHELVDSQGLELPALRDDVLGRARDQLPLEIGDGLEAPRRRPHRKP
jgi:hypothetical protein